MTTSACTGRPSPKCSNSIRVMSAVTAFTSKPSSSRSSSSSSSFTASTKQSSCRCRRLCNGRDRRATDGRGCPISSAAAIAFSSLTTNSRRGIKSLRPAFCFGGFFFLVLRVPVSDLSGPRVCTISASFKRQTPGDRALFVFVRFARRRGNRGRREPAGNLVRATVIFPITCFAQNWRKIQRRPAESSLLSFSWRSAQEHKTR